MRKGFSLAIVVLAAASAASPCTQPNLLVAGIQGDMAACPGAIDFTSASYSMVGSTYSGGGSGAGKSGGTLHVTKYFDSSSPKLMLDCMNGKLISTVTLSYPSAGTPVTMTFKNVYVTSVNESVNPTNEAVDFKYQSLELNSGGTQTTSSIIGSARASTMTVALVGGDGKTQTPSHLNLTVTRGGTTFNSVQLAPTARTKPPLARGAVAKGAKAAAPAESLSLNFGHIEFKSLNGGSANFHFDGGTLVNGNLRVSKVNFAPTAATLRR